MRSAFGTSWRGRSALASRSLRPMAGPVLRSDKIARPLAKLMDLLDERAAKIAATVSGRMDDAGMIVARASARRT